MKLTPRLQAIADNVKLGSIVADIGTDHGYIPIYLIENKIAPLVIASDVNEGPLDNARRQINHKGLEDKIILRIGNGLSILDPGEVNSVIIAGMGGLLIRDILRANPVTTQTIKQFILQPMVAQGDLRRWLIENGFKIVDEKLAKEGNKYYEIIVAELGFQTISDDIYYDIGYKLIENKDPLIYEFINKNIQKQKEILNSLRGEASQNAREKYAEVNEKIAKLEEVLRCL